MAYFRCGLIGEGVKLPDRITFTGYASGNANSPTGAVNGSCLSTANIPTLGYKYANVSLSKDSQHADNSGISSSVGVGNNINISNVTNITISSSANASKDKHGVLSVSFSYTVTLHN